MYDFSVHWRLRVSEDHLPALIREAAERGLGDPMNVPQGVLVAMLMMDAGEDGISQLLEDPANVSGVFVKGGGAKLQLVEGPGETDVSRSG